MRQKTTVMSPTGLGTKNDYAGKSQQQFTWPIDKSVSHELIVAVSG
jgi:hypothetical protein